jgi:hypothetical protein
MDRAAFHIRDLRAKFDDFIALDPWSVKRVPTTNEHESRLVFVKNRPIPLEFGTIIGDAVHNMRSALDAIAYALARRNYAGLWTDDHERAAAFPILATPTEFDSFFGHRWRRDVFDERDQMAMRSVQSFYHREQTDRGSTESYERLFQFSQLNRLRIISNIDKHRRLPLTAWALDIVYWGNDSEGPSGRQMRPPNPGDPEDTIGYFYEPPGTTAHEPHWEFVLELEGEMRGDFIGTLEEWHQWISTWAIPQVFWEPRP